MTKKSIPLEIDSSIIEKNMKIIKENPVEEELNKLLRPAETVPSMLVKPSPGMCVKTHTLDGKKVFVNVCVTDAIPAPPPLSNEELLRVLSSEDPASYRVPMSLGAPRSEADRSGQPATVCDVAVNTGFFQRVEGDDLFRAFFLTVVLEGLQDKYQLGLNTETYTVLKNRKSIGTLQAHRVEQREVRGGGGGGGGGDASQPRPLVQEVAASTPSETSAPLLCRLRRDPRQGEIHTLLAEVRVSHEIPATDVSVEVGGDRVVVRAPRRAPLDLFLPCLVEQDRTTATLHRNTQILTIKMPVIN